MTAVAPRQPSAMEAQGAGCDPAAAVETPRLPLRASGIHLPHARTGWPHSGDRDPGDGAVPADDERGHLVGSVRPRIASRRGVSGDRPSGAQVDDPDGGWAPARPVAVDDECDLVTGEPERRHAAEEPRCREPSTEADGAARAATCRKRVVGREHRGLVSADHDLCSGGHAGRRWGYGRHFSTSARNALIAGSRSAGVGANSGSRPRISDR